MATKRCRKSTSNGSDSVMGNENKPTQSSCASINNLPDSIIFNVLLKLSIKRIVICKCVCKAWNNVISDPEFAKLHLAQAKPYPLVRPVNRTVISRTLYFAEPEDGYDFSLRDSICSCASSEERGYCKHSRSNIIMKLDTKLKIPVRGLNSYVCNGGQDDTRLPEVKRPIRLNPNTHDYDIANSCNGLLCLCDPFKDEPYVICNPVTGEFINLPKPCPGVKHRHHATESPDSYVMNSDYKVIPSEELHTLAVSYCGLGFSPKDNQYKVIRTFGRLKYDFLAWDCRYSRNWVAEMHKLGTSSWVRINDAPCNKFGLTCPTYANGSFYWFPTKNTPYDFSPLEMSFYNYFIVSFDFDIEKFSSIPLPPTCHSELNEMGMGVLRGALCVFDAHREDPIVIWQLNNDATEKYWTKLFSIETDTHKRPTYKSFIPVSYYNEEALTMLFDCMECLVYYHPKNQHLRYFKICGRNSEFEVIVHVPSIISFKDILKGTNVEVFNVKSRCGQLKVRGETKCLVLKEDYSRSISDE